MSGQVSWNDYEGVDGFGAASQTDVDGLNKALAAGQTQNPPAAAAGDGFSLRVESLENTLKNVTYKMDHVRFWKAIPKLPAYNTVEEHNEIQSYGANSDTGFVDEGDLPESDDSTYERKFAVVKYMGTTRTVTHVMSLVEPAHGNVIAQETINGTMHLLRMLERALFYGDSSLSSLQFDGFEKLITDNSPTTNVIDLRGQPLSEDVLNQAALTIFDAPNYGIPTHLHVNPKVKADLAATFFPKERLDAFASKNGMIGNDVKGFTSGAGDVQFEPNVFISDGGAPGAAAVGDSTKRPGTPTISSAATSPANAASQFAAADVGSYRYDVVAVNRYGRSAPVAWDASAIAVAAGDDCRVGVTPGGATSVGWWEIFRSEVGGADGTERLIQRVANAAGAGESTLIDLNADLPYCSSGFMFQQNLECLAFKQLAPMVKMPLATISPAIRWMQLIYGTPVLYTPGKVCLLKNIGRASGYVGAP